MQCVRVCLELEQYGCVQEVKCLWYFTHGLTQVLRPM
uniref:Uncharacterized protein n=1 Tax=Anguilla anguilla TaxID=7936 RepID=A0A0E9SXW9_ANGAN